MSPRAHAQPPIGAVMTTRPLPLLRVLPALVVALGLGGTVAPPTARAQAPDVRNVRPVVMLLVDSSGSMEYKLGCSCATPACTECAPDCDAAERNRWATVLEALNGRFESFDCAADERRGGIYAGQYDQGYLIPHYRIVDGLVQRDDGILDTYRDRVKFGLMTFDGQDNFDDLDGDVTRALFEARLPENGATEGDYSFGEPKPYLFPGCPTEMMLDNGARNEAAGVGRLVSVGTDVAGSHRLVNDEIQASLASARPYGATPIAGLLDDVRYYFANHPDVARKTEPTGPGDPYFACRPRYVVLVTDGLPNGDKRGEPHLCETPGYACPYDRPEEIAADLCQLNATTGACEGTTEGVFVVGFDIADPLAEARLDDIASVGGTDAALFANDRDTLMARLGEVLDKAATGTTTRTVPAFATNGGAGDVQRQFEFNTGFQLPDVEGEPWRGVLERRRIECVAGEAEPVEQDIDASQGDRFDEVLDARTASRVLYTVLPTDPNDVDGYLLGSAGASAPLGAFGNPADVPTGAGPGGEPTGCVGPALANGDIVPDQEGLELVQFARSNSGLSDAYLDAADSTERGAIIDWVHAEPGTAREDRRLGDIYHSSPAVVGPPSEDLADESFNIFRNDPVVAERPTVLYVGTNDGVLHAFATENARYDDGSGTVVDVSAGEELWGFVPPFLLPKLKGAMSSRQWMVDGTPVVKEVFYTRRPRASASVDGSEFRTVLVVGLRGGGNAYFALDVTNPIEPEFLWQFSHARMGDSYGEPALGQVLVDTGNGPEERAIAILPGGTGDDLSGSGVGCGGGGAGCTPTGYGAGPTNDGMSGSPRAQLGCWSPRGRHLFVLDVATGKVLRHLDDRTFNSPLVGGVALFTGDVGTVATRAYLTDTDGMLWRLDLSSPRVERWTARPFHDLFYDLGPEEGMPGYEPPIVSTDETGSVVVLQGTGDIDVLDALDQNRVVSLTEKLSFNDTGEVTQVEANLNWEIRLDRGEQVTGPMDLFDSRLFFSTFASGQDPIDACAFGESYLWGVHYTDVDAGSSLPEPGLESIPGTGTFDVRKEGGYPNQIIMGVTITQRPTCFDSVEEFDPYVGRRYKVARQGGGNFDMVANVSGTAARPSGSGTVGRVSRTMPSPLSYTTVQSWAGSAD